MLLLSATLSAQSHQTSDLRLQPSDRMAAYREAIGLDMSVPDFSTKKIDAKVMGTRLAGILEYMLENCTQGTYSRLIALMKQTVLTNCNKCFWGFKFKKHKLIRTLQVR